MKLSFLPFLSVLVLSLFFIPRLDANDFVTSDASTDTSSPSPPSSSTSWRNNKKQLSETALRDKIDLLLDRIIEERRKGDELRLSAETYKAQRDQAIAKWEQEVEERQRLEQKWAAATAFASEQHDTLHNTASAPTDTQDISWSELKHLREQVKTVSAIKDDQADLIGQLRNENLLLKTQVVDYENEKQLRQHAQQNLDLLEKEKQAYQERYIEEKAKVDSLREKLLEQQRTFEHGSKDEKNYVKKLQKDLVDALHSRDQLQEKLDIELTQNIDLLEQVNNLAEKLAEAQLHKESNELSAKLSKNEIERVQTLADDFKRQHDQLHQQFESVKALLNDSNTEVETLRHQIDILNSDLDYKAQETITLQEAYSQVRVQAQQSIDHLNDANLKNEQLTIEKVALQETIDLLARELENLNENILQLQSLKEQLVKTDELNEKLRDSISVMQETILGLQEDLERKAREAQVLENMLSESRAQVPQLEFDKQQLELEKTQLNETIETLLQQVENLKNPYLVDVLKSKLKILKDKEKLNQGFYELKRSVSSTTIRGKDLVAKDGLNSFKKVLEDPQLAKEYYSFSKAQVNEALNKIQDHPRYQKSKTAILTSTLKLKETLRKYRNQSAEVTDRILTRNADTINKLKLDRVIKYWMTFQTAFWLAMSRTSDAIRDAYNFVLEKLSIGFENLLKSSIWQKVHTSILEHVDVIYFTLVGILTVFFLLVFLSLLFRCCRPWRRNQNTYKLKSKSNYNSKNNTDLLSASGGNSLTFSQNLPPPKMPLPIKPPQSMPSPSISPERGMQSPNMVPMQAANSSPPPPPKMLQSPTFMATTGAPPPQLIPPMPPMGPPRADTTRQRYPQPPTQSQIKQPTRRPNVNLQMTVPPKASPPPPGGRFNVLNPPPFPN